MSSKPKYTIVERFFLKKGEIEQILNLPTGSRILSVIEHNNRIALYALVNPKEFNTEIWTIYVQGSGFPSPFLQSSIFLGTIKLDDGNNIFHIFYTKN
ncbi:MAG: DUF7352 domain-containing protein [bacterium]